LGLCPGITRLPKIPTTNPNNIHPKTLISHPLSAGRVISMSAMKELHG
jgi:hypothetical protein